MASATTRDTAVPHGFASTRRPGRDELLAAPVHWRQPARLEAELELTGRAADGAGALGLLSIGDLLEHLPRARREARTVAALTPGEAATVVVEVRTISQRPVRRRGMRALVEATVFDETATMRATFFNQPWLAGRYRPGTRVVLHGKYEGRSSFKVSHHAVTDEAGATGDGGIPHYAATDGLSSTQIFALMGAARPLLAHVSDALPGLMRAGHRLPDRAAALGCVHFAETAGEAEAGRRRLAFEELLMTQLGLLHRRARRRNGDPAVVLADEPSLTARWLAGGLPFELTGDQRAAIETVDAELGQAAPMQRLLMGEVGSGKTVVALFAMLRAAEHGHQAVLMAPTETLAEQHFATIQGLIGGENLALGLLTGSTPAGRRSDILGKLRSGALQIAIGTHALIEPTVGFASLTVAVVDEQHRFGVRQRAALDAKSPAGVVPHVLHMTATPIPRTLALCAHGDLDQTRLRELPRGRQAIETHLAGGERERTRAYERIREELRQGRQAFVVCPLVEPDESPTVVAARAATVEYERLASGEFADFRVVLLHGQLHHRDKQAAMAAFASGEADVLVATSVVEVGIDVPNATVMLIENAERFGISQLHQLRGRVGRGEHASVCLLFGPKGSQRLRALANHTDGFELAEIDLEMRQEGDLIGTRQSGIGEFRVARLPGDEELLEWARAAAAGVIARDPDLRLAEHVPLAEALAAAHPSVHGPGREDLDRPITA
ncbi:MAG TPA: ATP-dependent DNA helicase RecG [Solirubrobacteraceae bacterium]|jgi:ATP-dependent DNA helicase RecG|nr:ATP-dependent DNA helicase RecG [Solirubrobacteraceae bacterium]